MADLVTTAASCKKVANSTMTDRGIAGVTITASQPVYRDSTNADKLALVSANAESTSICAGIALHAALAEQPIEFAIANLIDIGATVTVGQVYVASATAGGIAPYSDLVSGKFVSIIGVGTTTGRIEIRLNNSRTAKA